MVLKSFRKGINKKEYKYNHYQGYYDTVTGGYNIKSYKYKEAVFIVNNLKKNVKVTDKFDLMFDSDRSCYECDDDDKKKLFQIIRGSLQKIKIY